MDEKELISAIKNKELKSSGAVRYGKKEKMYEEKKNDKKKDNKKKVGLPGSLTVTNPEIPAKGSWKVTKEDIQELMRQKDVLIGIRGRVVDATIEIENLLDSVVTNLLFQKEPSKITLEKTTFKGEVLDREFFTLMNKWKVFKGLCHSHDSLKSQNYTRLLSDIHKIINIRNRFAHGKIYFKEAKMPTLEYYENGKKEDKLDNDYFDNLNSLFNEVHNHLFKIYSDQMKKEENAK